MACVNLQPDPRAMLGGPSQAVQFEGRAVVVPLGGRLAIGPRMKFDHGRMKLAGGIHGLGFGFDEEGDSGCRPP